MQRILITGANRGIGLEFTRQYAGRGERVIATCRNPDAAGELRALADECPPGQISILPLDVTDGAQIEACYQSVRGLAEGLDVLVNNAGFYQRGEHPGTLDAGTLLRSFEVNAIAPIMVAQRFLDLLRAGDEPKIVNLTSHMGSITLKGGGGNYGYSTSKTALNMLTRLLAHDLRAMGIVAIVMHPGWVKTDMGGSGAPLAQERSVTGMIRLIDGLRLEHSGKFWQWDGELLPW
jgi:NAD(P)-dependent dehydrogenase (short-subunit alcohol dehydrogenase family)